VCKHIDNITGDQMRNFTNFNMLISSTVTYTCKKRISQKITDFVMKHPFCGLSRSISILLDLLDSVFIANYFHKIIVLVADEQLIWCSLTLCFKISSIITFSSTTTRTQIVIIANMNSSMNLTYLKLIYCINNKMLFRMFSYFNSININKKQMNIMNVL